MYSYVFSGQGSQRKGMGKELFDEFPDMIEQANQVLGYSITELCLENHDNKLKNTLFAQPAIYVVNALDYLKRTRSNKSLPEFLAGHSLGEFSALFAAGAFSFEEGLHLVDKRAKAMASANGGSMCAVMDISMQQTVELLSKYNLSEIDIANINDSKQTVISGINTDIENAIRIFSSLNIRSIKLNVSGAFHSRYMKECNESFVQELSKLRFNKLQIPVISNVTGAPYENNVFELLSVQMLSPVKWIDCINYILSNGSYEIISIGNNSVLDNMILNIKKDRAFASKSHIEKMLF